MRRCSSRHSIDSNTIPDHAHPPAGAASLHAMIGGGGMVHLCRPLRCAHRAAHRSRRAGAGLPKCEPRSRPRNAAVFPRPGHAGRAQPPLDLAPDAPGANGGRSGAGARTAGYDRRAVVLDRRGPLRGRRHPGTLFRARGDIARVATEWVEIAQIEQGRGRARAGLRHVGAGAEGRRHHRARMQLSTTHYGEARAPSSAARV